MVLPPKEPALGEAVPEGQYHLAFYVWAAAAALAWLWKRDPS
jgi:hypothetical protein